MFAFRQGVSRATHGLRLSAARLVRMTRTSFQRVAATLGCLVIFQFGVTGCTEHVCGSEFYPVAHIGDGGGYCVKKGADPKAGYIRFPKGKVPNTTRDKWSIYWDHHYLDKNGNEHSYSSPDDSSAPTPSATSS
jgi:hypothetical protein